MRCVLLTFDYCMKILSVCVFGCSVIFFFGVFRIQIIFYLNNKYYNCSRMTRDMTMGMNFFFLSFRLVRWLCYCAAVPYLGVCETFSHFFDSMRILLPDDFVYPSYGFCIHPAFKHG